MLPFQTSRFFSSLPIQYHARPTVERLLLQIGQLPESEQPVSATSDALKAALRKLRRPANIAICLTVELSGAHADV
jgi:hypothetical protein